MKKIVAALLFAVGVAAAAWQPVFASAVFQEAEQKSSLLPILGVVVLLAPFAWMIYKSRGRKEPDARTSGACLPIIDESKSPFKPVDDEETDQQKG